jgi:septum formation protein
VTPLVLASASAARAALLKAAGVDFEAVPAELDEGAIKNRLISQGEGPLRVASALAERKALAVARNRRGLVMGADQTLELDGALVDKAKSPARARAQLEALRGRRHLLHSAVALAEGNDVLWRAHATARLAMRQFSDDFLQSYLARQGDSVLEVVGGYRLEGEGAQLFEQIDGDYFAILGLPLLAVLAELRRRGALPT